MPEPPSMPNYCTMLLLAIDHMNYRIAGNFLFFSFKQCSHKERNFHRTGWMASHCIDSTYGGLTDSKNKNKAGMKIDFHDEKNEYLPLASKYTR